MPTLMESFSGTYLEAFHFGTPVLTSDLDFARETCGEAALYFDPTDTASIRDAIVRVRNKPLLAALMRVSGEDQLARLEASWDQIAANLLDQLIPLVPNRQAPPSLLPAHQHR